MIKDFYTDIQWNKMSFGPSYPVMYKGRSLEERTRAELVQVLSELEYLKTIEKDYPEDIRYYIAAVNTELLLRTRLGDPQ